MADPEPLELLSYGVDQISRGNLDYRLEYSNDDEFLPVCTAFNGVASTPEMQKRYLDTIKRKTEDIENMVSALFAYSKLDMEEFEINMERHYSLVFHGIIGIVIAATAVRQLCFGHKELCCRYNLPCSRNSSRSFADRFNRKFDSDKD